MIAFCLRAIRSLSHGAQALWGGFVRNLRENRFNHRHGPDDLQTRHLCAGQCRLRRTSACLDAHRMSALIFGLEIRWGEGIAVGSDAEAHESGIGEIERRGHTQFAVRIRSSGNRKQRSCVRRGLAGGLFSRPSQELSVWPLVFCWSASRKSSSRTLSGRHLFKHGALQRRDVRFTTNCGVLHSIFFSPGETCRMHHALAPARVFVRCEP